jgi:hypothetical protein
MRLDYLQIINLVARVQGVLANRTGPIPRGDVGLYLAARSLADQLERTNPNIAQAAGYAQEIPGD